MRASAFVLLLLSGTAFAHAQRTIRQVDFRNFTYAMSHHLYGKARLQWLDDSPGPVQSQPVHLVNGKEVSGDSAFSLSSVTFAAVGGDSKDDAIVILKYNSGSQTTGYIYVYSFAAGKPRLLGFCRVGSGGHSALASVSGDHGLLVIDQEQPNKPGKTTTPGVSRTRFAWKDGHFEQAGPAESVQPQEP